MSRTKKAVIDERGDIRFVEPTLLPPGLVVLVTIPGQEVLSPSHELPLLSESAPSDRNRPEEDEAWADFQADRRAEPRSTKGGPHHGLSPVRGADPTRPPRRTT
jgi:hypothetical protein